MQIQRAAERRNARWPMCKSSANLHQMPQIPHGPHGMNPPPWPEGLGGHLELWMGPTGMQQQPLWAQGGLLPPPAAAVRDAPASHDVGCVTAWAAPEHAPRRAWACRCEPLSSQALCLNKPYRTSCGLRPPAPPCRRTRCSVHPSCQPPAIGCVHQTAGCQVR